MFGNMMGRFDQRLNNLANASNERDTIVIELFKMLKDSMESRVETLFQFYKFRRKMEMDQRKSIKGETGPPLSLFSRLKRKKDSP